MNNDRSLTDSLIIRTDLLPLKGFHSTMIHEEYLKEFVRNMGAEIFYRNDLPSTHLSSIRYVKGRPIILINSTKSNAARWFLLGHEIGHLWLHGSLSWEDMLRNKGDNSSSYRLSYPDSELHIQVLEDEATYLSICTFVPLLKMIEWAKIGELSVEKLCQYVKDKHKLKKSSKVTMDRMKIMIESLKLRYKMNKLLFCDKQELDDWYKKQN